MSIYKLMEKDWKTYCIMSAIVYIEEMSKPNPHIQIKKYKSKKYTCSCFHTVTLRMKDREVVNKLFEITKNWELKKHTSLIGKTFKKVRKDKLSGQDMFNLTPLWLNNIIAECGKIPNKYSFEAAKQRINNLKHYKKIPVDNTKNLFRLLFKNRNLAAGAFIVSMDLEFRGIQTGQLSLCMSEKYRDFLNFMLDVAKKWGWTSNKKLSSVSVDYRRRMGINASPQYEFRMSIKGLREIYSLMGPLSNPSKDKCIKFHVDRSKNYINLGSGLRKKRTKEKILGALKKSKNLSSTDLQFVAGTRVDVVLDHLKKLEGEGKVVKERKGKKYIWNINANKSRT